MRILVADDDELTLAVVSAVLEPLGHELVPAKDGLEALERFKKLRPDLVLADYEMPGLNGAELCRRIRAWAPGRYVPVVMITGGVDRSARLKESMEAGAIEFLTKPILPDELRVRVGALVELARLHNDVVEQKNMWEEEALVLKHIMDRYVGAGRRSMPYCFAMDTLRTERINGDVCVYRDGLPGIHCGMIVDATGHGLTAGVSTIPVVEAFLSMVGKDIPLETVYHEVNLKLRRMLPTGRFACMLMWRVDTFQETLTVLNAGMPAAHIAYMDGSLRSFRSRHLPAGLDDGSQVVAAEEAVAAVGDRFFAVSDGFIDIILEEEALATLLEQGRGLPLDDHWAGIQEAIANRVANAEHHDDISWALWEIPPATFGQRIEQELEDPNAARLVPGLKLTLQVDPRLHSFRELVPNLLGLFSNLGVRQSDTQVLALLIFEAVSNALDHGLLGLESRLKEHSFEDFEVQRKQRLATLVDGRIDVTMTLLHEPDARAAVKSIRVDVQDSGSGFDWRSMLERRVLDPYKPHGRGITLILSMAKDVHFNEAGTCISFTLPCR